MTLRSGQLGVSSAAQYDGTERSSAQSESLRALAPHSVTLGTVTHASALPPCRLRGRRPVGPPLLDLTGLSVIAASLETP
jgi:hypothetical protein